MGSSDSAGEGQGGAVAAAPSEYCLIADALVSRSLAYVDLAQRLRQSAHPGEFRVLRVGEPEDAEVALLCLQPGNPQVLLRCSSPTAVRHLLEALPDDRGFELWVFGPWTPESTADVLGGEFIERRWYHSASRAELKPFNADTARRLSERDARLVEEFGDAYARRLFTEFLNDGYDFFGVADDDGLLSFAAVSSAQLAIIPGVGWVVTRESCRGRGFGKAVVSRAAVETLARADVMMYGGVAEGNVASMRLCRSIGFRAIGCASLYQCGPRPRGKVP